MPEFDIIRRYFKAQTPTNEIVCIGIGDDAAVLKTQLGTEMVVAVDTLVSGVHFPLETSAFDIGYKALAVNLSDMAAMGAKPQWMTLALTLPQADETWLQEFSRGLFSLANKYNVALIGGDTTQGPLTVSIQIGGIVDAGKALLRSNAKPGDTILVTGTLGDAARGLQLFVQGNNDIAKIYLDKLNQPTPRVEAGHILSQYATSCIDISDGLYADLSHITESSGVGAIIDVDKLPLSETLQADDVSLEEKYRLALGGGDDYELCFTVAEKNVTLVQSALEVMNLPCTIIGQITDGNGVQLHSNKGSEIAVDTLGYEHFT